MSKDIHKRISLKGLDAELELLAERVKKLEEKDASDVRDVARDVPLYDNLLPVSDMLVFLLLSASF